MEPLFDVINVARFKLIFRQINISFSQATQSAGNHQIMSYQSGRSNAAGRLLSGVQLGCNCAVIV